MRGESLRKDRKASNGESERYTRARAQVMRNRMEVVPANEMCFDLTLNARTLYADAFFCAR